MRTPIGFGWESISEEEALAAEAFYESLMGRPGLRARGGPLGPENARDEMIRQRIEGYQRENAGLDPTKRYIVLFGSSTIQGPALNWAPTYIGVPDVLNRGIQSQTLDELRARIQVSVFDARPSHVFLLNGRNDLWNGRSVDSTFTRYRSLVDEIRRGVPQAELCIITCAPVYNRVARIASKVIDLNGRLLGMTRSLGLWGIDLHAFTTDSGGLMQPRYRLSSGDPGMHMGREGYRVLGPLIRRVVEASRIPPGWHPPLALPQPQIFSPSNPGPLFP